MNSGSNGLNDKIWGNSHYNHPCEMIVMIISKLLYAFWHVLAYPKLETS